jgi:TruD family tRNA pseudouridine synthase
MEQIYQSFQKEKEILEKYKKESPELLFLPFVPEKDIFSRIGIDIPFLPRPQGHLRFYLQDFVVEEISRDGEISEVGLKENKISPTFPFNLGCDLIKIGISTLDAINILAETLQIKIRRVTYAGLKDTNALTSQKIIFLDVGAELFEKIKKLSFPNFFLTNFSIEKEFLSPGRLSGNRFFIFIRIKEKVNNELFSRNLEKIKKEGFLNFYFSQRFGEPRLINHYIGKLILQGKYEEAIFNFLTNSGLSEIPLIQEKRNEAKKHFGNWQKMEEIFFKFPFTFRNEISLLSYLKENPTDFLGALIFVKDLTQIFIFSYASYLFNKILSLSQKGLELPEEIPLFLSPDLRDRKVYQFWLEKDKIEDFEENIQPFIRFFKLKRRFVKTKVFPKEILFKIFPEGVALNFILEKGAYATTFLANLFELKEGLPFPDWVKPKEYDLKKEFRIGSIDKAKELLDKKYFQPF